MKALSQTGVSGRVSAPSEKRFLITYLASVCCLLAIGLTAGEQGASGDNAKTRTWSAGSGQTVEAEFVKRVGPTVYLKNAAGKTLSIELHRLSEKDQEYLRTLEEDPEYIRSLLGKRASAEVYPFPGDLSGVEHLAACKKYSVKVNGKPCFVYYTDNYFGVGKDIGRRLETGASFACFSFVDPYKQKVSSTKLSRAKSNRGDDTEKKSWLPVLMDIECNFPVKTVCVRPTPFGIKPRVANNTITLVLSQPRKLVVEVNDRMHPLFIFADPPEAPNPSAKHYFKPGVHHVGTRYVIKSGEKMYIAGGAVVEGTLLLEPSTANVEIRGRGVLTGGQWTYEEFKQSENTDNSKALALISGRRGNHDRFMLEGLCLVNSPGWNVALFGGNDKVFRNLKVISWNGNTDGPWLNGDRGLMEDCFVFNNDDSLCLGYSSDCVYRNNVLCHGLWGAAIICRTYSSMPANKNTLVENTYLVSSHQPAYGLIQLLQCAPTSITRQDFVFRNLYVEACDNNGAVETLIQVKTTSQTFRNIVFANVKVDRRLRIELDSSAGGLIDGVKFVGLEMAGKRMASAGDAQLSVKGNVNNITFK